MPIAIRFHPSVKVPPELDPFPGALLATLLREAGLPDTGSIDCILTDDEELGALNERFRNRSGPTDVLAFPYLSEVDQSGQPIGDVYVSLERAALQAAEHGEPVAREVWRLFVHGVLHLAGHDHDTPASDRTMREIQERWVNRLEV